MGCTCSCNNDEKKMLIYSCSGGADVGGLTDRAARYLNLKGVGKMHCLAGIGANLMSFVDTAEKAPGVIAIDGCPVNCTKKCLESHGVTVTHHFLLSDMGFKKGESPISNENVNEIVRLIEREICHD